jgi:hypothetical protein
MVEGLETYQNCQETYKRWMTETIHTPRITMIESAVRLQFGYGYGFDSQLMKKGQPGFISAATFEFARDEFQYFRFGLGFTLMEDGYFTHEVGDSWHGQDWHYDELDYVLGSPKGNATTVHVVPAPTPSPPPAPAPFKLRTVRVFRQKFTLEECHWSHACSLQG